MVIQGERDMPKIKVIKTATRTLPGKTRCLSTEKQLDFTVSCPVCDKRAFDISETRGNIVKIRLKCPHCRKVVEMPLSVES